MAVSSHDPVAKQIQSEAFSGAPWQQKWSNQ
jgi:hypothetical protein